MVCYRLAHIRTMKNPYIILAAIIAAAILVAVWMLKSLVVQPPTGSFHDAVDEGYLEVVKQHLAASPNVNAKDVNGRTPLYIAANRGHTAIAKLLIANGADVSAKRPNNYTPLHSATDEGHKEIAELLIAKGADVNAKTESGQTPLDLAILRKKTETADLLRKHGAKTGAWFKAEESIHIAAMAGHIEAVKKHLADGADVNAKVENSLWGVDTPLDKAIRHQRTEIVDLLRKHGGKTGAELKAEGK